MAVLDPKRSSRVYRLGEGDANSHNYLKESTRNAAHDQLKSLPGLLK